MALFIASISAADGPLGAGAGAGAGAGEPPPPPTGCTTTTLRLFAALIPTPFLDFT